MPPNLLFLFTDQQRPDTLGCYGNPLVQTPNLDRLAASGTLFENAYCTQPVCTPSRAALLTGCYPHTTGCIENHTPLPAAFPTLAERLPRDYARAYMGKWHLGNEVIPQRGFDQWVAIDDNYRERYSSPEYLETLSPYHHFLVANGFTPDVEHVGARIFKRSTTARLPEPYTKARFLGQSAANFLRDRAGADQPFALYVSFFEPHPPFFGPFDDMYPPEALPVGPHFRRPPPATASLLNRLIAESYAQSQSLYGQDLTDEQGWRKLRAKYLGLATLVDRAVGDILAALDASGQAENTIVVFTSDHGEMAGDHYMFQKGILYEESIKVPLLVRVPWARGGPRRVTAPVSQIDLVPTLLDLLDQPVPGDLPGRSRAAVLAGGQPWPAEDVVVEWNGDGGRRPSKWVRGGTLQSSVPWERVRGPWRTLRAPDGYKLNLCAHEQSELYDLERDPFEEHNLFSAPEQRARLAAMIDRLRAWQAHTADAVVLPGAPVEAAA
jgi:arylsulfatase A-like enzyme